MQKGKLRVLPGALVEPKPGVERTGCLHCPLFPFSVDFKQYADGYRRDADAVVKRAKEPHVVRCRNVSEPWEPVDVLFVGEAPGADEDKQGKPFVGRSGGVLRRTVEQVVPEGLRVGYTNVVRCRPPLNRTPNRTEIQSCAHRLDAEIAARAPKVIVPLGNVPLHYLTGLTGITTLCGALVAPTLGAAKSARVVPCVHPAYVLRAEHELERFVAAIRYAPELATGRAVPRDGAGHYQVVDSIDDAEALLRRLASGGKIVAFDTETGSLSPFQSRFPKLLCFSFSDEPGKGYVIPLDHPESPWAERPEPTLADAPELDGKPKPPKRDAVRRDRRWQARMDAYHQWKTDNAAHRRKWLAEEITRYESHRARVASERPRLLAALRAFFSAPGVRLVGQNEKFDRQHIRAALGVWIKPLALDTMTTHMTLDDRPGTHGLDALAAVYTGMGGYDRPLADYVKAHAGADPSRGGSYAAIPARVLFPYAAMDADVTLRCLNAMRATEEYRKGKHHQALAEVFFPQLSRVLAEMEYAGTATDFAVLDRMQRQLTGEIAALRAEIARDPKVIAMVGDRARAGERTPEFNPLSAAQLGKLLWEYYGLRPTELTDAGLKLLAARYERLRQRDQSLRFADVIEQAIAAREWGLFSTAADVLHDYAHRGVAFVSRLLEYREKTKLLNTYVLPSRQWADARGRVHGTFHITGTLTGRLSSSNPNRQNADPRIRRAVVSRFPGGVILQADYSQIELRLAACMFDDPELIAAYRRGEDAHTATAIRISGLSAAAYAALPSEQRKAWRVRAKRVNFGIIYSIGAEGIQLALKRDGVFIGYEEAVALLRRFRDAKPKMMRNMQRLQDEARRTGIVTTFTGRIRRVPEVFSGDDELVSRALRQVINAPIQSGAADITLIAMILIRRELRRRKLRARIIINVHDSIVLDCPIEEALEVAALVKDTMEHVHERADDVLPLADWSWVKVPLVAECEVGYNWYDAVPVDPAKVGAATADPLWRIDAESGFVCRPPVSTTELRALCAARRDYGEKAH